jgi:hypothetical protein
MLQTPSYQLNRMSDWETDNLEFDRFEKREIVATVERDRPESTTSQLERSLTPPSIRLDFEGLNRFETVESQYSRWGVTFANTIAIQPSNPSFPPHSGQMVVMGAPKNGLIELTFQYPVRWLSGFVTSSRGTMLSAFDRDARLLDRVELLESNLYNYHASIPANTELKVQAEEIYRVTFYALQGQLVVDDISFGF